MANLCLMFVMFYVIGVKGLDITCPPDITRFAYGPLSTKYHDCTDRNGEKPLLRVCDNNSTYLADEQVCEDEHAHARVRRGVSIKQEMLMGRQAGLGDFYDARNNKFYRALSLWKQNTINANMYRTNIPNTKTEFYSAKTAYSKMSHMDISAEIKLSFLGGLIAVTGSAEYLRDSVESEDQVDFNMAYFSTTHAFTLPTDTPIDNQGRCGKDNEFTHVVSSVIHGMGANFVYKRYVKNAESAETVSGFLSVAVKSIPGLIIEGKASIDLTGEQKKFFESIDIRLFGDFVLPYQPTTFEQSIKLYQEIPKELGAPPDYSKTRVVKVTLTPISFYCKTADNILVGISKQLLSRVSVALDEMEQILIKISTLLLTDPATKFIPVRHNINDVKKAMLTFHSGFQTQLKKILPLIRGGGGKVEGDLIALLQTYNNSPLRFSACSNFLTNRAREINAIDTVIGRFTGSKNLKVVDYESADDVIALLKTPVVVILDLYILQTKQVTHDYLDGTDISEMGMWFNRPSEIGLIGRKLREFKDFVEQNVGSLHYGLEKTYLVRINTVKPNNAVPVNVVLIKNFKQTDNFTTPLAPSSPQVRACAHNSITIARPNTNNAFVTGVQVRYWQFGEETNAKTKVFPNSLGGPGLVILGLRPITVYRFITRFVTEAGLSPDSALSHPTPTLPSTPPLQPRIVHIKSTRVSISWTPPTVVGRGVVINGYDVQISSGDYKRTKKTPSPGTSFTDLEPATIYSVHVKATSAPTKLNTSEGYIEAAHQSNAAVLQVITPPLSPEKLSVDNVGYTTADVLWSSGSASRSAGFCSKTRTGGCVQWQSLRISSSPNIVNSSAVCEAQCLASTECTEYNYNPTNRVINCGLFRKGCTEYPNPLQDWFSCTKGTAVIPGATDAFTVTAFQLQYAEYNATTSSKLPGSTYVTQQITGDAFSYTVTGLQEGRTYGMRIKIETSRGASEYSTARIFTTKFRKTDAERVTDSILAEARSDFKAKAEVKAWYLSVQAQLAQDKVQGLVQQVQSKYDAKKTVWPIGSYCILKNSDCPPLFREESGFIKGINIKGTDHSYRDVSFGDSFLGLDKKCSTPSKRCGEIKLATCCTDT